MLTKYRGEGERGGGISLCRKKRKPQNKGETIFSELKIIANLPQAWIESFNYQTINSKKKLLSK